MGRKSVANQMSPSMTGALADIVLAAAVLVVPMLVLSAILLALIFSNQVHLTSSLLGDGASTSSVADDNAFYVDYSATRLITVASWTSTVTPLLPTFVMILLSYPIAKSIWRRSGAGKSQGLPTPYQTSLLLQIYTGSIGSLWPLSKYVFWKGRERMPGCARLAVTGLVTASTIGFGILAADTWLHATTSTVSVDQYTLLSQSGSSPGKALNASACPEDRIGLGGAPCSINVAATSTNLLGSDESFKTFANRSALSQLLTFEDHDGNAVAYLAGANLPSTLDYQASTYAIGTTCSPISQACNLRAAYGASTPYNCTPAFSGDLTLVNTTASPVSPVSPYPAALKFFEDPDLTQTAQWPSSNPLYIGATALLSTSGGSLISPQVGLADDPEITRPIHGGLAWILSCTLTVYDLQYTWSNGSIASWTKTSSNDSMAAILGSTISGPWAGSYFTDAAVISSFRNTAADLAYDFATQTSQIASSMGAGILMPRASDQEQTRKSVLVARVPKAPLFTLIGLNLLYALTGLLLALFVLVFSRYDETREIQARLSITGLAAASFEPTQVSQAPVKEIEDLFVEKANRRGASRRIGFERSQVGGWRFSSYQ